jgi:hypothetical protein
VTVSIVTSLHALFMEQSNELCEAIDVLAERIRVLDQAAPFGPRALRSCVVSSLWLRRPVRSIEPEMRPLWTAVAQREGPLGGINCEDVLAVILDGLCLPSS